MMGVQQVYGRYTAGVHQVYSSCSAGVMHIYIVVIQPAQCIQKVQLINLVVQQTPCTITSDSTCMLHVY